MYILYNKNLLCQTSKDVGSYTWIFTVPYRQYCLAMRLFVGVAFSFKSLSSPRCLDW